MSAATMTAGGSTDRAGGAKIWQVIGASSVGTMIEWYDWMRVRILRTRNPESGQVARNTLVPAGD